MKLLVILIVICLKISQITSLKLTAQEELFKSMSVFDVIETNDKSPSSSINQPTPNQYINSNKPEALINTIPGAPIPKVQQQPIASISSDIPIQNEQTQLPDQGPISSSSYQPSIPLIPSTPTIRVPINENRNINTNSNNQQSRTNVEQIIEKIKDKVSNPYLKANFTLPNIANFFANFISGNEYLNNLQVKEDSRFKKVEVTDSLSVKKKAKINDLEFNNLRSNVMNITENEIVFDPDTKLRMKNSKIAFKIKDIFEVIAFMKYILRLCGSKLEKCDFSNLLSVNKTEEIVQIFKYLKDKKDLVVVNNTTNISHTNSSNVDNNKTESSESYPTNNIMKKKNLRSDFNFKQKTQIEFENVEKESKLGNQLTENRDLSLDTDYLNYMENPEMERFINNYYYSGSPGEIVEPTADLGF